MDTRLSGLFGLCPGEKAAIVGCGGKTSLMYRLALENSGSAVLIGATARMMRPPNEIYSREINPGQLPVRAAGVTLFSSGEENGKLFPSSPEDLEAALPFFDYAFFECDGSRGLPLKGWETYEPAAPGFSTLTIGVCQPVCIGGTVGRENTHRPDRFREITGADLGDIIEARHISAMISHKNGMFKNASGRRILFINQVESPEAQAQAREIARLLPDSLSLALIACGSLTLGRFEVLWRC